MSKVLFWVVLIFVVLFVVRLIGSAQAKKRREREAPPAGADMVRCAKCGTFVPRAEAIDGPGGFRCREGNCLPRERARE